VGVIAAIIAGDFEVLAATAPDSRGLLLAGVEGGAHHAFRPQSENRIDGARRLGTWREALIERGAILRQGLASSFV
jgi:hypothetical protein